jgi:predicted nucleic acid-binding Zn ribbon protein
MRIAETIRCVECGATAHLLTAFPEDDPPQPGDIIPYRCEDCMERFDVVLADEDDLDEPERDW